MLYDSVVSESYLHGNLLNAIQASMRKHQMDFIIRGYISHD